MACRGCSSSNRRNRSSYGCRKAVQSTRWGAYTYSGRSNNGCTTCACNTCGCNTCGCNGCGCNGCGCNSCGCNGCGCNSCACATNGCVQPRTTSNGCSACGCSNNGCNGCGCNSCACATNGCVQPRTTSNGCSTCGCSNNGCCSNCRGCTGCAGSPFYTGPCGPVDPVCCCTANCPGNSGSCACNSCNCPDTAVYGHFTQEGGLDIEEGEAIPFNGTAASNGILKSGGELTITESGAYMISLSVTIPANTTLTTDFITLIDDGIVAGGTLMIDKTQTDDPLHAQTQTVVSISAGAVLRVVSSESVSLSSSDQIAALTIIKIA